MALKLGATVNSESLSWGLGEKQADLIALDWGRSHRHSCSYPGDRELVYCGINRGNFVGRQTWLKSSLIAYLICDFGPVN